MKRVPAEENVILEWPSRPSLAEHQRSDENKPLKKEEKQTPAQMIRFLQGIFCKGRYYSWILAGEAANYHPLKPRRGNTK
jgi:hypothetical protein